MLGKLHGRAAMADGEAGPVERPGLALLQRRLELTVVHVVDQVERARSKMGRRILGRGLGGDAAGDTEQSAKKGRRPVKSAVHWFGLSSQYRSRHSAVRTG
jgi:hypothetical protein